MTIKLKLSIIWFFAFLVYLGNLWFELRDFWRIDLWKTAFGDIFCQKLDFTRAAPLVLFIDKFWYLFSLLYLPNMDRWEEGVRRQIDDDGIEIRLKSWLCSREDQAGKEGRQQENKQSARSTHLPSSRLDRSLTWGTNHNSDRARLPLKIRSQSAGTVQFLTPASRVPSPQVRIPPNRYRIRFFYNPSPSSVDSYAPTPAVLSMTFP